MGNLLSEKKFRSDYTKCISPNLKKLDGEPVIREEVQE
jgi:hypothetical protein